MPGKNVTVGLFRNVTLPALTKVLGDAAWDGC